MFLETEINWIFFLKKTQEKPQHHQTQQTNKNPTKTQNLQEQLFVVKCFLTNILLVGS